MNDLERLFYWRGIESKYENGRGELIGIPIENRLNLLKAMGVNVNSKESIRLEAHRLDVEPWKHWFPKLQVTPTSDDCYFEINLRPEDKEDKLSWRLSDEEGNYLRSGSFHYDDLNETAGFTFKESRFSRRKVFVGHLRPNYYTLNVLSDKRSETTKLAVFPERAYQPECLESADSQVRPWGAVVQLSTLTTSRNWGVGDFTDLRELIERLAKKGADLVALDPLHVLSPQFESFSSSYRPSDRRFINPLYIDPYWIPDFNDRIKLQVNRSLRKVLRESEDLDYSKIRDLKYPVFYAMYESFLDKDYNKNSDRAKKFVSFVEGNGNALLEFAKYEALNQRWAEQNNVPLNDDIEHVDAYTLLDTTNDSSRYVLFHAYLQWLADQQLDTCHQSALRAGMNIGLVRDLAVGAEGDGAEVSTNVNLFCQKASMGLPRISDTLACENWQVPPSSPSEMRRTGFAHYINLLRSNMKHCGALRIEHAASLMRLWWYPQNSSADSGAYVNYPFNELLGLLCLESHLNQCAVITDDEDVAPDDFRSALSNVKAFTNNVFYFERVEGSKLKAPADYEAHSLAMLSYYDMPSLMSWWNSSDLTERKGRGDFGNGDTYESLCKRRKIDKENLFEMLEDAELLPERWGGQSVDDPADKTLVEAVITLLSKTASKLFVIRLDDLIAVESERNISNVDAKKTSCKKLSVGLNEMFSDARVEALLDVIHHNRTMPS